MYASFAGVVVLVGLVVIALLVVALFNTRQEIKKIEDELKNGF